jgi:deoxyribodipyrimidine photo-lyase
MRPSAVVWLVRDTCRLVDNPALIAAAAQAKQTQSLMIPLVCLEPRRWADQQYGLPRIGSHWSRFRVDALRELKAELEALGSALWIAAEEPDRAMALVSERVRVIAIFTDLPLATEERLENAKLESEGYVLEVIETNDLYRAAQLPFELDALPKSFTQFRKSVERPPLLQPPDPVPRPTLLPLFEQPWILPSEWLELVEARTQGGDSEMAGGRMPVMAQWHAYLGARALSHYKETRNAFEGEHQSSRLSAGLAHGCISPREIWYDTLTYEQRHGANESTYWLRFELLWREYFRWYSRASDWTLFRRSGPADRAVSGDQQATRFRAWREGQTGCDIVDAAMRELRQTGWMSNRARQLVASHCVYESGLDWRLGAAWFEAQLVDHDVASNWGNWAYIAGVGADPRGGRVFNLDQQASRYDPEGVYRDRWLSR